MWWLFALLSAVFAALTSILAKVGIENVDSTLATAIRTVAVVGMSWLMVFITNTQSGISSISKKVGCFLFFPVLQPALRGFAIIKQSKWAMFQRLFRLIN